LPSAQSPDISHVCLCFRVPIYGSGPHRYLRPDPWDPTKVADPTRGAGSLRPTTRPAGSVCSLYATAVTAGIAANILEYARWKLELLSTSDQVWLCSSDGMRAMFRLMSDERHALDGFRYVAPWLLWNGNKEEEEIKANIMHQIMGRT
jgi:hypothetical protein